MVDRTNPGFPGLRVVQTSEQIELLNVVDSLRAHGLGELTELPQLIVCGDQSSGKSSVLEAISGIPFPRQDVLCTRFPTEVILRRAPKERISVSIVPAEGRTGRDKERLLQFQHNVVTLDDFLGLFEDAKAAMGLSTGKSFSEDVLRIEFCGPAQPQLTLVDLPGLIHSEMVSQTAGDVTLVSNLVARYMTNRRSIVLAIISAKYDASNQVILSRARGVDLEGTRTLGIITKPDTLADGSLNEKAFINLAKNQDVEFQLGWHVVMNLDSGKASAAQEDRDEQEALYFKTSNFRALPSHNLGIASLRSRLSKILFNHIRAELPRVVKDIEDRIEAATIELAKLGPGRPTVEEQREFLIKLSEDFQRICQDAIEGHYNHAFFQSDMKPERRLCAILMNKHFEFAENLQKNGCFWKIEDKKGSENSRTREEAIQGACKLLKDSRGRELPGLPNPHLVGQLFRMYSKPWEHLARQHIKDVWDATNRFVALILEQLTDIDITDKVYALLLSPIMEKKLKAAYDKLDELLEVHKEHPMTTNSYFVDNRKKRQLNKCMEDIEERLREFTQLGRKLTDDDISKIKETMAREVGTDMDIVAAEDVFDNMMAYYTVAMKLFMDNVPSLAIQAPVIRKLPEMFCPTTVFDMKAELVTRIAGEAEEKVSERNEILRKLETLQHGFRIFKQYSMRPQTLPTSGVAEIGSLASLRNPSKPQDSVAPSRSASPLPKPKNDFVFFQTPPSAQASSNLFSMSNGSAVPLGSVFAAPKQVPADGPKTGEATNGFAAFGQSGAFGQPGTIFSLPAGKSGQSGNLFGKAVSPPNASEKPKSIFDQPAGVTGKSGNSIFGTK